MNALDQKEDVLQKRSAPHAGAAVRPKSVLNHKDGYDLKTYHTDFRLLPLVGMCSPGERFENEHFRLSKHALQTLKNADGSPRYSGRMIDLIWPPWKKDADAFQRRDEALYHRVGIEFREFNQKSHLEMSLEAAQDLLNQIRETQAAELDLTKTGIVLCSANIVNAEAQGTLRTDYLKQSEILSKVSRLLNIKPLFTINEACSGFVAALMKCQDFLERQSKFENIIVINCEKMSEVLDFSCSATSIIFTDQATATMVTKQPVEGFKLLGGACKHYPAFLNSDGTFTEEKKRENLMIHFDDGQKTNNRSVVRMQGRATYVQALKEMPEAMALIAEHLNIGDMKQVLIHQANQQLMLEIIGKIKKKSPRIIAPINIEKGNCSSATIPTLIAGMVKAPQKIVSKLKDVGLADLEPAAIRWRPADRIGVVAFGAGVFVRAMCLEYKAVDDRN